MPDQSFSQRHIAILGVRGVPAEHGGFETFVARLAPHLASIGWAVSVYCQEERPPQTAAGRDARWQSTWEGVTRIHIGVGPDTPFTSIRFDFSCISDVLQRRPHVVLILGYNTAVFAARLRRAKIPTVINMDGIEWSRAKWSMLARLWLYLNDRAGCLLAHHLIADHPHIETHLRSRTSAERITVIPYGAEPLEMQADREILERFGLTSKGFATVIARAEPENSILEMVRAFSARDRGIKLVVLGRYYSDRVGYHAAVHAAAGPEVLFLGAIYEKSIVQALRRHSLFYMHGHRVGGTNPSLLEAMGAGNPVLAHDNRFNRWVVRDGALYFTDQASCERALEEFLAHPHLHEPRGVQNLRRAASVFNWEDVLLSYGELLTDVASAEAAHGEPGWGRRTHWRLDVDAS